MRIQGELMSDQLVSGLNSNDPDVKAAAEQYRQFLLTQLIAMGGDAAAYGLQIGNTLENKLEHGFNPTLNLPRPGHTRVTDGGHAAGGYMGPGELSWVGERGPELIRAGRQGATVTPNHALGGGAIHVVSVNELRRLLDEGQGRMLALAPSSSYSR
jgi:hypothetical protein